MNSAASSNTNMMDRARRVSVSIMNVNPQLGMWQAAGTAIAHAPNLTELRDIELGGNNIAFNSRGHSARFAAVHESTGDIALVKVNTTKSSRTREVESSVLTKPPSLHEPATETVQSIDSAEKVQEMHHNQNDRHHHHGLFRRHHHEHHAKAKWLATLKHGLSAFWKFFRTPAGFLMTIYFLNIVAWGAMLFFLLLKAAPAMNHPSADDDQSPRKKWLEIDSQILNALFCVTGFGLAPWRFRDLYFFIRAVHFRNKECMRRLVEANKSWFRPPAWYMEAVEESKQTTFTTQVAPPTPVWKLGFTIWMMILNTLLQAVLCFFMWHYNRINRPGWATGTFIALGCGSAMLAGLVSWWEGRKVKTIEGPSVEIV